mmetsp:Transcript_16266/g.22822  ORF Transcript_16266/g.22822 Transcript_16266/m.22822 type:complete len:209 (-) Transcript_16266:179-805(-)|eukprot:CAMPEP_0185262652 /NCGR_PEP_ID=MMETSP1359-20130426/10742_1 /TAXON_ID=552665 /ORGANISM="Bigelowiella longifila, Strain CCMP242" /LENGTH=208 /DNA_ID=CAMNT_0027849659 /DNA_START=125 /DNA_END=751 /DNA_ORIENTATION=+
MAEAESKASPKVLIVYYSMYKHIEKMAVAVGKGVEAAGGKVTIMRAPETLSEEVLKKMNAPEKNVEHKVATPQDLADADAIIFGIPTRFGMAAAQMKALIDHTGGLWMKGDLVGKPASMFVSTATQGGGQETTNLTFVTQLVHHGMIYVPIGYACKKLFDMSEVHGGTPYGAGCFAGADGSREPSKLELEIAEFQGSHVTKVAAKLCK